MNKLEFEQRLSKVYNGSITPLTSYVNLHCTMQFHCIICDTEFFNKASHMIGKDPQRHVCTLPYADRYGTRLLYVSTIKPNKKKYDSPEKLAKRLNEMVENGLHL